MYAVGSILNVGSGEDPAGFGDRAVHLDIDVWKHDYFVRADGHHLPFKDQAFDTVILGDILEHATEPLQMLRETKRVGKRVLATVFEEWRIQGLTREQILERAFQETREKGYESLDEYKSNYPAFKGKFRKQTSEYLIPHSFHINAFTDEQIVNMLRSLGMKVKFFAKVTEGVQPNYWNNWIVVLE